MRRAKRGGGGAGLYVDLVAPLLIGVALVVLVVLLLLFGGHGGTP